MTRSHSLCGGRQSRGDLAGGMRPVLGTIAAAPQAADIVSGVHQNGKTEP